MTQSIIARPRRHPSLPRTSRRGARLRHGGGQAPADQGQGRQGGQKVGARLGIEHAVQAKQAREDQEQRDHEDSLASRAQETAQIGRAHV